MRPLLRLVRRIFTPTALTFLRGESGLIGNYGTRNNSNTSDVFHSPFPDVAIPNITYHKFALEMMEKHGNKLFLVNGETGAKYSYHEALREVTRVSSALIRLGLKRGDRVAFYSFNRPEYVLAWFAAVSIGAVASDANPNFTAGELYKQMNITRCKFVFAHQDNAAQAKIVAEKMPGVQVLVFGEASGCVPYSTLVQDSGDLFPGPSEGDQSDFVHLPCSSGTTGLPKAVQRTHFSALAACYSVNHPSITMCAADDRTLLLPPLFHIYAHFILGSHILEGGAIILNERFKPQKTLHIIQQHRVTNFPVVPPIALFLVQHPMISQYDLSSLKSIFCGGAPVSRDILEAVKERLKLQCVRQGYGMTEFVPASFGIRFENTLSGVGFPVINTQFKVISLETGESVEQGVSGELLVKGPQIMTGYQDNEGATNDAITKDGWLRTGDIGYVCSKGIIHIVDRLKDIIKVKGHQVAPAELEDLLLTHPGVQDAAVVGIPDQRAGELPRAFVVLKNKGISVEELKAFVSERTSTEKHLAGGVFVLPEIPKSASGKILKKELREICAENTNVKT